MKSLALLAVMLVGAAGASAPPGRTLRGDGITVSLPRGWHGLACSGGVQAADFALPQRARASASLVRVPRGRVHLIVWNYGPWFVYLPHRRRANRSLVLRRRDLLPGGVEGFGSDDTFAIRNGRLGGDLLEVLADLGPKPLSPSTLRRANAVLSTLRVPPAQVLRARNGRLAADGVAVRLLPGWSGRMEIPADRYGARLVLRATRADVHVELVETPGALTGNRVDLPIVLSSRNVSHRNSLTFAHRVFATGGRSFELNVTMGSPEGLRAANRLLATLRVAPRPWTLRSCDPVLKLRGPGVRVVLTELLPREPASGRIIRQAGRRSRVEVAPASAAATADAVLATLRAKARS